MLLNTIVGKTFKFEGVSLSCAGRETTASFFCSSSCPWFLLFSLTGSNTALFSAKFLMSSREKHCIYPQVHLRWFLRLVVSRGVWSKWKWSQLQHIPMVESLTGKYCSMSWSSMSILVFVEDKLPLAWPFYCGIYNGSSVPPRKVWKLFALLPAVKANNLWILGEQIKLRSCFKRGCMFSGLKFSSSLL